MASPLVQDTHRGLAAVEINRPVFSPKEQKLMDLLVDHDQAHLFANWPGPGEKDDEKRAFLAQVKEFQRDYPGGIKAYVSRARKLLEMSRVGANPYAGFQVSEPLDAIRIRSADDFARYEPQGRRAMADAAFVVVAGGLGERLGFPGIKLSLPSETVTGTPYLQLYILHILAFQNWARRSLGPDYAEVRLPLGIMTSDDTDALTRELLRKNENFGLPDDQLFIFKQGKVPSLLDNDAHFAAEDTFRLDMKPHGHGDVHMLLHSQGIVKRWTSEQWKRKWVCFFQDTNGLVFRALPAALGVSVGLGLEVNSIAVPRRVGDAVGAICCLTRESHAGKCEDERKGDSGIDDLPDKLTINVEYNQMQALMGDQKEPLAQDGSSVYPGNINALVFDCERYQQVLERCEGRIVEFVNPKYKAQSNQTEFQKPTRLECMMQDYPKLLPGDAKVGFCQFERWTSFSALKNSISAGRQNQAAGNAAECAATAEADQLAWGRRVLSEAGVQVEQGSEATYAGVTVEQGACVVLAPSFGTTQEEIRKKFLGESFLSARSTLVLDGEDITVESLQLDGVLWVQAMPGAQVHIRNLNLRHKEPWCFQDLPQEHDAKIPSVDAIRSYKLSQGELVDVVYRFDQPGEYVLSNDTLAHFQPTSPPLQRLR